MLTVLLKNIKGSFKVYAFKFSFFFKKMGQSRPLFCLFLSSSHYNFNNTNWKKHRWCAGDLNPCSHDGRRWQYHGAMSAAQVLLLPSTYSTVGIFRNEEKNTKLSLHMHWLIELSTWYPLIPAMGPSIPNHFEIFLFETHTQKKQ